MSNILLIHPSRKILGKRDNLFTNESLVPSLGLASIAAYCQRHGIKSKIIDLRLPHRGLDDVIDYIKRENPLLVGITAFTFEITSAHAVATYIKKFFPEMPVVIGGPHVSMIPLETMAEFQDFDIAVAGEGEETILEIIRLYESGRYDEIKDIQGIAFRRDGEILLNPPREPIADINKLPFPAWDLFEIGYYKRIFPVSTSRGCPYSCYFCTPRYLGRKVRLRNYISVVDEIEWLINQFGCQRVQFADATFALLKDDAMKLCEEMISRGINKKIRWDCETRADSITPELLKIMKEAGCEWVAFGVETGNERILNEIVHKGETKEDIRKAIRMTKRAGLKVRCFFILGHYTETVESIKDTINFALELNPDALSFGLMVPNPGSEIRRLAEQKGMGLRVLHNRWEDYQQFDYNCFELEDIPLNELKKWQSRAYFTFYIHHPLKALRLFIEGSAYNYRIKGLLRIIPMLIRNYFKKVRY